VPQFTPPLNRKESQPKIASSSTMTRQEKDAERKRLQRANETPEEKEGRNEKRRLDARRKRSSESSDASLERLSKQQVIDTTRRNNETAEQHRLRLTQQQVLDITRRSNETAEQHQLRLNLQQVIDTTRRSDETVKQHRFRLDQQQVIDNTRRSDETAEQHRLGLDQQQVIDNMRRSDETAEQHRLRLDQQQVIDNMRRSDETADEKTARIRSISRRRQQRTVETRNNPPAKTWPAAISQKVKDQCLIEFNNRMSMDSVREQVCVACNSQHNETTMHKMLLSDINDSLLKPHRNLLGTIPGTRVAHSQDSDFDEETVFFNEQGEFQRFLCYSKSSIFPYSKRNQLQRIPPI
jgi:hypothetical protein